MTFKDVTEEQCRTNPFAKLVPDQKIVEIPEYTLECGETLFNFPIAYKTWGKLNDKGDNVLVICHALSGSADVADWWSELLGPGRAFDPEVSFIICINFLGSPYGSCSPVSINKKTGEPYGPSFPLATFKDDVGIQKMVLDDMNVSSVECVIGGSMGGMLALEFISMFNNTGYIKKGVVLATAARTSAWCISWNITQRECIFNDPFFEDGLYYQTSNKPDGGLSAARMAALLTYRSRDSFETRFGGSNGAHRVDDKHSAHSYLQYNGKKFINRFDANCYISISRKLDTNDLSRGRSVVSEDGDPLVDVLKSITTPTLVVGIESDNLFTITEQKLLADNIPNAIFEKLDSNEGHDAFLLEFEKINGFISKFLLN
ncbi:FUB5 Homoserine O-acetyltransferase FUB5 [Candida maltosa Xu316]|uniref:Homoserine O-acetyltransferase n=1 Tax=Candida maltosa (strain Xu316) TaxID=1245528 RepID=M3K0P6_CANMX|nr:Homoserine O-acetyltransferase [Candida maltosa Xu316]